MRLSELMLDKSVNIYRDGNFEKLSYITCSDTRNNLVFYESSKYKKCLNKKIACVICREEDIDLMDERMVEGVLICDNPMILFWQIHNVFDRKEEKYRTSIGKNCRISERVSISPQNVTIGNNVIIEEFVSIKDNVTIGDNVIIRSGSVIGGVGHYYKRFGSDKVLFVEHFGGVKIDEGVEIQQMCSIHKSIFPWEKTIIGENSKMGDYVHIGHECVIGKRCFITGKTLVCGASEIGDDVWIGPASVIKNGVKIGNQSYVAMGSTIRRDIGEQEAFYNDRIMSKEKFVALNNLV